MVSAFKHKQMEIVKKYKVYELNNIMGSSKHKALEEVEFKGWKSNSFDTEEEAVQARDNYIIENNLPHKLSIDCK